MQESLLHYIWQFQYFHHEDLKTTTGEPVRIYHPGHRNLDAGPDFSHARIRIGDMEWIGSVEIHIFSSGWLDHKHDADAAYDNVILHVVWEENESIYRKDGSRLPALELKGRVDESLLWQYRKLVNNPYNIPCAHSFNTVSGLVRLTMLDRALVQRLENKAAEVFAILQKNRNDWEETCYQLICRNFGFKVNKSPCQQLAQTLPYRLLRKHAGNILQIEALIFGQAGFLEKTEGDDYYQLLLREYRVLAQKYRLAEKQLNRAQWKFLRLRPANFPTIRLAQLAMLLNKGKSLFSRIIEGNSYADLRQEFSVTQSDYWQHHYRFASASGTRVPSLGEGSIDNIIINTVAPLLVAYAKAKDEQRYTDRAIQLLQEVPSEHNAITRAWQEIGYTSTSAFDSQALIELHNNFCQRRRCLECAIGFSLMRPVHTDVKEQKGTSA